jgi:hypothetical protein
MKKILKRVFVIVFAATLFAIPVSTAYAATVPVLVIDLPEIGVKVYSFSPPVIEYNDGLSTAIYDPSTSNQTFHVPAGKTFDVDVLCNNNATLRVTVFDTYHLYFNEIITSASGYIEFTLPPLPNDVDYSVWLTATTYDVTISAYEVTIN